VLPITKITAALVRITSAHRRLSDKLELQQ
jgi:hypothetical protein